MQNSFGPTPQYPIEGVDRALRVLSLFRDRSSLRLMDVRNHLGVGQSTAHRLMAQLVFRGYAVQDQGTRAYRIGPALHALGLAVVDRLDLRAIARPVLEELASRCGETVHLGVLEGAEVRYVDCIESPAVLRVSGRVGQLTPAHASSLGKAMLATLGADDLARLFPAESLPAVTERTLTSRSLLLQELEVVRQRGYARNREEVEPGVTSVAVAVRPVSSSMIAAMSIATPVSRQTDERVEDHVDLLRHAVGQLREEL